MSRLLQIALDALLIVGFAAIGRRSHTESLDLGGVAHTAAPFVAGALIAWALILLRGQGWPLLRQGLAVLASTVILGMVFRALIGEGVQPSFIAVTTVALGLFLLGWRGVALLVARSRHAPVQ